MRKHLVFLIKFGRITICTLNLSREGEIIMSTAMNFTKSDSKIRLWEAGSLLLGSLPVQPYIK